MKARYLAPAGLMIALLLSPGIALAHGETATTIPQAGASLKSAPTTVSVDLTEAPTKDSRFEVVDGCGDTVSQGESVDGQKLSVKIQKGQPGRWEASYRVVSAVDGHPTNDSFSFTVKGKKDCSAKTPKKGTPNDPSDVKGGRAGPDGEDEGGAFPVIPVVVGTAVLVGAAVVIRARSA